MRIEDNLLDLALRRVRAGTHAIRIGTRPHIQDGVLVHVTQDAQCTLGRFALTMGNDVSIGQGAALHGCSVREASLIGVRAIGPRRHLDQASQHRRRGRGHDAGPGVGERGPWLGNPARCERMSTSKDIEQICDPACR